MAEITHQFSKLTAAVKQSETRKSSSSHINLCLGSTETAFKTLGMSKYNE